MTKRAAFWLPSVSSAPPPTVQSLVSTPTGLPCRRAKPRTIGLPQVAPISKKEVWGCCPGLLISTIKWTSFRISYARARRRGMKLINSSSRLFGGSGDKETGGKVETEDGRKERKVRVCWKASSSEVATLSTVPFLPWISQPPSSSLDRSSKVACLTIGGPAAKS